MGDTLNEVSLAGTSADIVSQNNTVTVVRLHAGTAGSGGIKIAAESGAFAAPSTPVFAVVGPGRITEVSSKVLYDGAVVTIKGLNLLGGGQRAATVTIGDVEVAILDSSDSAVLVQVPDAGLAGQAGVVVVAETGAVLENSTLFEYLAEPVLANVEPTTGVFGTRVTLSGTGLGLGDEIQEIRFGYEIALIAFQDSERVEVICPAGTYTGQVEAVRLTAKNGAVFESPGRFAFQEGQAVESIEPGSG